MSPGGRGTLRTAKRKCSTSCEIEAKDQASTAWRSIASSLLQVYTMSILMSDDPVREIFARAFSGPLFIPYLR